VNLILSSYPKWMSMVSFKQYKISGTILTLHMKM